MKKLSGRRASEALTLIEVLVVIAVIAILLAMLLPATVGSGRSLGVRCLTNLRQIDVGFVMYTADNKGKFPMQSSITNGGTMEYLYRNQTFPHFRKLSHYVVVPNRFICPFDKERRPAATYEALADTNISYFLNADVTTNAASILVGDRNLQADGKTVEPGLFVLTTNENMTWSGKLHPHDSGNLAFADGHAEMCRSNALNVFVARQSVGTNRLSVP